MKILIVEDDRDLADFLSYVLTREGFEVEAAFNLPTARKLLAVGRPDLILLDRILGPCDGLALLGELGPHRDVPVIVLSGRDDIVDRLSSLERGADDFLGKPFSYHELIARVREHLARRDRHEPHLERAPHQAAPGRTRSRTSKT